MVSNFDIIFFAGLTKAKFWRKLMSKKNIHIAIVLLIGVIAGFLGGYLFNQSSKLKQVNKKQIVSKNSTATSEDNTRVEEKGKIFQKNILAKISAPKKQPQSNIEENTPKSPHLNVMKKWLNEYIITPYFIEDLVNFILESYEPPNTQKNPSSRPLLNISLRTMNARYGLELIGFKVDSSSIEKARKKILSTIMNPELLKSQYEHYCDIFINELINEARNTTKKFIYNGKIVERELSDKEIKDLLIILSDYVQNVSSILKILSTDKNLLVKLDLYLKADKSSMHYNYLLNQIINKYEIEKQKNNDLEELKKLEKEKQKTIKDYERALRKREQLREEIIKAILTRDNQIKFSPSQILYLYEWIHRRIKEGKDLEDINNIAVILDLVAQKLNQKTEDLSSNS